MLHWFRVVAFLRGGRTRRHLIAARTQGEAWGMAHDFAHTVGAFDFKMEG